MREAAEKIMVQVSPISIVEMVMKDGGGNIIGRAEIPLRAKLFYINSNNQKVPKLM